MKTKEQQILQAVEQLKKGHFGTTAIKVELEGQLNRRESESCEYCDEGDQECGDCYNGYNDCNVCHGSGEVQNQEITGEIDCPNEECDEGQVRCEWSCDGGYTTCGECGGDWEGSDTEFNEEVSCYNYMMSRLVDLGLARAWEEGDDIIYDYDQEYTPTGALRYANFYNDGSVDSEFTFTLMLDDPQNILLLPKIIEVWNELVQEIGNDISVSGAGMHMALINSKSGTYPSPSDNRHTIGYGNFQKSMRLLLPALFFLGSVDNQSRSMRYRKPNISSDFDGRGDKYSAISYRHGAVEFRVFETCYENPEQILDNVVVMSKAMKYWRKEFLSSGVEKITPTLTFGNDSGLDINRLYATVEHIDVLNFGLNKLKPSYYTIGELKKQRNFVSNKRQITKIVKERQKQAEVEYEEYEERFKWNLVVREKEYALRFTKQATSIRGTDTLRQMIPDDVVAEAETKAREMIEVDKKDKQTLDKYVSDKINDFLAQRRGQYQLV